MLDPRVAWLGNVISFVFRVFTTGIEEVEISRDFDENDYFSRILVKWCGMGKKLGDYGAGIFNLGKI